MCAISRTLSSLGEVIDRSAAIVGVGLAQRLRQPVVLLLPGGVGKEIDMDPCLRPQEFLDEVSVTGSSPVTMRWTIVGESLVDRSVRDTLAKSMPSASAEGVFIICIVHLMFFVFIFECMRIV